MLSFSILFILLFAFFYFPGYLLWNLFYKEKKIHVIESFSLFFTIGYSFFIVPGLLSYFFQLEWLYFYLIYSIEILVLFIYYFAKNKKLIINLKYKIDKYDALVIVLIVISSVILLFHGAFFIGDNMHHLSYVRKLASNNIIDPYVSMFKGVKEVGFSYAYCINYIIIAFLKKISFIDVNKIWNVFPAVCIFYITSAAYFVSNKILKNSKYILLSIICFYIFHITYSWAHFLGIPRPSQFARYIFLVVGIGLLLEKVANKRQLIKNAILIVLTVSSIIFTHVFSFFAFYFILGFYIYFTILFFKEKKYFYNLSFYLFFSLLFIIPFKFLRINFSNFLRFSESLTIMINKNILFILLLYCIIFIICLGIVFVSDKYKQIIYKHFRKTIFFMSFALILILLYNINNIILKNVEIKNSVVGWKYKRFLNNYFISYFDMVAVVFLFIVLLYNLLLKYLRKIKEIKIFDKYFVLLLSIIVSYFVSSVAIINYSLSKIISQVYSRRYAIYIFLSFIIYPFALKNIVLSLGNLKFVNKVRNKIQNKINIEKLYYIILIFIVLSISLYQVNKFSNSDHYDYEYIFSKNNVYKYINKNISSKSVFFSYGYAANYIVSQTDNFVLYGGSPHMPPISIDNILKRRILNRKLLLFNDNVSEILNKLKSYECNYIFLENNKTWGRKSKFSIEYFRYRLSFFPEIFKVLYTDKKYILYSIDYKIDLQKIEKQTKEKIKYLIKKEKYYDAYKQSAKLLTIKKSAENYKINEKVRNIVHDNLDDELANISYSLNFPEISTNFKIYEYPLNVKVLLNKNLEIKAFKNDKLYLAAAENIKKDIGYHSLKLNFKCIRTLRNIKIEWYNEKLLSSDFSIYSYNRTGKRILVYNSDNNKNLITNIKFKNKLNSASIEFVIRKTGQNRILIRKLIIK